MKNTPFAYENYLRNYLQTYNFPEAENESFIIERAESAYDVFCDARRRGIDVTTSQELAIVTIMQDLELSMEQIIADILETNLPDRVPEYEYPVILADMAEELEAYESETFGRYTSIRYAEQSDKLRDELISIVDEYLTRNGL